MGACAQSKRERHSVEFITSTTNAAIWVVVAILVFLPLAFWPSAKDPNAAKPLVLCVCAIVLLIMRVRHPLVFFRSPTDVSVAGFMLLTALSLIYSKHRWTSLETISQTTIYVAVYYLLRCLLNEAPRIHLAVKGLLLGALVMSLVAVAQQFGYFGWNTPWTVGSTWFQRTYLAAQLLALLPLCIWATFSRDIGLTRLGFVTLPCCIAALVFSGARIAWFGLLPIVCIMVAGGLVLANQQKQPLYTRVVLVMIMAIGVVEVCMVHIAPSFSVTNRFQTALSTSDLSNIERMEFATAAIRIGLSRPLLGCGAGTYGVVAPEYLPKSYWQTGLPVIKHAHNEYLQIFAELGIAGLAFFLSMSLAAVWVTFRSILNSRSTGFTKPPAVAVAASAGVAGFLAANLAGISGRVPGGMMIMYVCLALIACSAHPSCQDWAPQRASEAGRQWVRVFINGAIICLLSCMAISFLNQGKASTHMLKGEMFLRHKRHHSAVVEFKRACDLAPRSPEALYDLGNSYAIIGEYDKAIQIYKNVIALAPNYGRVHYNQGVVLLKMGEFKQAKTELEKAYQLDKRKESGSLLLAATARLQSLPNGRKERN